MFDTALAPNLRPTLPHDLAGAGFKPIHFDAAMAGGHKIGWFEIHAENYMIDGGPVRQKLAQLAEAYPISCHGVGLSIGSMDPLDGAHLLRLKTLLDWLKPAVFSEHLAWSSHAGTFYNDLLPLPYTQATLTAVTDHIDQVQETLGREMLLENPSTYIDFAGHEMSEGEFISEIIRRTGCGLLLDINNVHVTCINHNLNPDEYLAALPMSKVGEIHLAGHTIDSDDQGDRILIDSHNKVVADVVWQLYERVIGRFGAMPTLIEWDSDLPPFDILVSEADKAAAILARKSVNESANVAG